jgi:hypothetical protein
MSIPSCGTACFNQTTLYFVLWSALVVVAFGALVQMLNRMFAPSSRPNALAAGQSSAAPVGQNQHA